MDVYIVVCNLKSFLFLQVLVQGWRVTPQNVKDLLSCVELQLTMLEDVVADVTKSAHEQLDALRVSHFLVMIHCI